MTLISISKYSESKIDFHKILTTMILLKKYEIMILLTEEFNDNEIKAWVFNLVKILKQFSLSDISIISLGKLKLSYLIDNKVKCIYIQLNFSSIPKFVDNISKILKMDSHIIRFLVINKEEKNLTKSKK